MGLSALILEKREEILNAAARHGASNVRIFGSVARAEDRPDSDVDFLVTLERGRTLFDHAALILELERLLGRKVDVVTEAGIKERIRENILSEARPL